MMDIRPSVLLKLLLPLTPLIIKTIILNVLSLSKSSSSQSAKVEVIVTIVRRLLNRKLPLGRAQELSLRDSGIKGPIWIAKASIPAPPELDAHDALLAAIKELGNGSETFSPPDYATTSGEWTGWRANVTKNEPRPSIPEFEQYASLMKEATSPVTILYFHGGGFLVMDPASHRRTTSRLAKLTSGRVFSLRYRLAPQNPFPSALLDALLAYLYLLAPPPESFHTPIPASQIIFSGDSAGGNLAISLSLLILTLNRMGITHLPYHGVSVALTPPAGIAANSPWLDISNSLPSIVTNAHLDYLSFPPPSPPHTEPAKPTAPTPDSIWPTSPPRAEIYCSATLLQHPLVSPITALPAMWSNLPPLFICVGSELLTDGCTITTRHISLSQPPPSIIFAGYTGQPHCFALLFPTTPEGHDCFTKWSQFCTDAVLNPSSLTQSSIAQWAVPFSKPLEFNPVAFDKVSDISDDHFRKFLELGNGHAMKREEDAMRDWEVERMKAKL